MTARSNDAQDDMRQEEIADWLSSQGVQVHFSDEQWRALILATGVTAELASQAAGDFMPVDGNPLLLQLRPLLSQAWDVEACRDSSADDARRVDATLLLDLVEQIRKPAAVELSDIAMVVADTAHRPSRVLELMGLSAPAIPQVDAARYRPHRPGQRKLRRGALRDRAGAGAALRARTQCADPVHR